jgi:hypothetical protein
MLNMCISAVTHELIVRLNKLEKINLQTDHVVRILDGYMTAAIPHNIVESFKNAGISLIFDDDGIIRCQVTPETGGRCLIGAPFPYPLAGIELNDDEEHNNNPNLEIFASQMCEILGSEGEDEVGRLYRRLGIALRGS